MKTKLLAIFSILFYFTAKCQDYPLIIGEGTIGSNAGSVRLLENGTNGVHYVGFRAADNITGNIMWILPTVDGANGQYLKTNGSGVLDWATDANSGGTVTAVNGTLPLASTGGTTPSISITGLASLGGANQLAGVNSAATGWEYKTVSGTQGVSIAHAANSLAIGLGAITPSSVAATGTVTGSNLSGINTGNQTITLTGDVTGSGTGSFAATIADNSVDGTDIALGSDAQGDIMYYDATNNWVRLPAGTSGNFLKTQGAGANPIWAADNNSGGTVTSVSTAAANNGVTATWSMASPTPALTIGLGAITPSSVAASGTVTGSNLSGTHSGTSSGTNTGDQTNITGNAGTVTNGFYTTSSLAGDITGNPGSNAIAAGVIVNADVNAAAAIAYSKLNLAASILTGDIVDNTVTGTDVTESTLVMTGLIDDDDLAAGAVDGGAGGEIADGTVDANDLASTTVTAGSYTHSSITVDADGRITAASNGTGGSGTVTSVAMSVPAFLSVAGSPITTSGTLAVTLSGTALPIANGGTAATTANAALNNLLPSQTGNSGKYLTSNGTNSSWATVSAGANVLVAMKVFTSGSGTYTPTTGTKSILVRLVGGGGAGGAANYVSCTGTYFVGSGGGAGGYCEGVINNVAASYAYAVGAGGAGNSSCPATAGGTGGVTTFGTALFKANGGVGGVAKVNAGYIAGGAGGTASGGTLNLTGAKGAYGTVNTATGAGLSGAGATSVFGNGGDPVYGFGNTVVGGVGSTATSPGSGGSGGLALGAGTGTGGSGAPGIIIIYEYK